VLPAAARLRRRAEFTATVRGGSRASAPSVVLHYRAPDDTAGPGSPRVGFVVGRTVGGAATRNRVRRRLRHLLRDRLDRLPAGSTLVVRATPAAVTATAPALAAQLDRALARLLDRPAGTVLHDPQRAAAAR
jgi:ribonuclease P protein component